MPKVAEADVAVRPASIVDSTPQEIDAMMAEAYAVDALFRRMSRGPFTIALAISTYLSQPEAAAKPEAKDKK
jgi:hypothetical protein